MFGFSLWVYSAFQHAIRVRILMEVYKKKGAPLQVVELMKQYTPDEAVLNRVSQLNESGYLEVSGKQIHLLNKGKCVCTLIQRGRIFLNIKQRMM